MLRRSLLKRKKPNPDSPAARAYAKVKGDREAKKGPKVYAPKMGICEVSGEYDLLDPHHLYRRSERPDLINDPRNILYITRAVHKKATLNRDYEKELQQRFYPNPPRFRAKNELNIKSQ